MNFIRKFIGNSSTDQVSSIPKGRFFLTRAPNSPKGSLECLYNDAFICIKQTTRPFYYQLTISKVYQEGEIGEHNEGGFDDSDYEDDDSNETSSEMLTSKTKDEWNFTILEDLRFKFNDKSNGEYSISWIDLNGDAGDTFEFIIDDDVNFNEINQFKLNLYKSIYELKYRKTVDLNEIDITEFEDNEPEDNEPDNLNIDDFKNDLLNYNNSQDGSKDALNGTEEEFQLIVKNEAEPSGLVQAGKTELYVYQSLAAKYDHIGACSYEILKFPDWEYGIKIKKHSSVNFTILISSHMHPSFNVAESLFIFSYYVSKPSKELMSYTFLIKFPDLKSFMDFKHSYTICTWESTNRKPFSGAKSEEEYLADALDSMNIDTDTEAEYFSASADEEDSEEEEEDEEGTVSASGLDFSSTNKDHNSALKVGYANDRSYVVRGNNFGVFKNDDQELSYQATIKGLKNKKGEALIPEVLMLQNQDQNMVFKGSANDSLYRMDLNRGQIVEEWGVSEDNGIVNFNPSKKLDEMTIEQTFSGISANALFRMDPRLKDIIVKDGSKQYKTKHNDFSTLTTTEEGYLAVGSGKGDIRLYDRIGINAKTLIPSLGDPIKSTDISDDGRWLIATCTNYLLLIDTVVGKGQRNEGASGFSKNFNADKKPIPRKLTLSPEHINFILNSTGSKDLNFTSAHFNVSMEGKRKRISIITSTGNYNVRFSLYKVIRNLKPAYKVFKFDDKVVSTNFKFKSNNAIIASENDVALASSSKFGALKE